MSEKRMKFKPQPRVSEHNKDRAPVPSTAPISGGAKATTNHLDRAIARKKRQNEAVPEGIAPVSGSFQRGELATRLGPASGEQLQKKFRKPDGRIGSISEYPAFAKAAKEDGND